MNFLELISTFWGQVIVGTLFTFYFPGYALVAAIFPSAADLKPFARHVLSMAGSMALVTVIGIVLAILERFNSSNLWFYIMAATGGLLLLGILRGFVPFRDTWHSVRNFRWQQLWIVVIIVGTALPYIYGYSTQPMNTPNISTWRYTADTLEIIQAEGIPLTSLQWDVPMPFVNNKIAFYTFAASWLVLTDLQDMIVPALNGLPILMRIFAMETAALFLIQLVSAPFTAIGLLGLFWTDHYTYKMHGFNGEGFGIGFLFALLWMSHETLFSSNRRMVALCPLIFAMLILSHGVAGLVGISLMGALYIIRLFRWPIDWRLVGQGFYIFAATGAICLAILLVTGRGTFTGSDSLAGDNAYVPYRGGDPTRILSRVLTEGKFIDDPPAIRYKSEQQFYLPISEIIQRLVADSHVGMLGPLVTDDPAKAVWVDGVIFMLVMLYLLFGKNIMYRSYTLATLAFLGLLFGLGVAFSYLYETWMPAIHPMRREFDFGATLNLIVLLMAVSTLIASQQKRVAVFARWIITLTLLWYFAVQIIPFTVTGLSSSVISEDGYAALGWLQENTPEDARILANVRTTGAFQVVAQRQNLTEGRTTYLAPDLLKYSLDTIDKVRYYMIMPDISPLRDDWSFDYVVYTDTPQEFGGHNFMYQITEELRVGLDQSAHLEKVAEFGDIFIYQVLATEEVAILD